MEYYSISLLILALWVLRAVSQHTKTRAFELVKPGWRVANPVSDAVSRGYRQVSLYKLLCLVQKRMTDTMHARRFRL